VARDLVGNAYATFTEGFGTQDLVAARALLGELGATVPQPVARGAPSRPPVRYARSGKLSIAYQVSGDGPVDVLLVPGFVSHLEKDWEEPRHARFLDRLGSFSRLIRFDKRGTGLSDRPADLPDLEARMDDVRAVLEAVGSERPVVFGYSEGGPLSILFAATHPEQVAALVLYGTFAKRLDPDDDYPWAPTREARSARIEGVASAWGLESHIKVMCPSADEAMARWWGERSRAAASPGAVRALMEMNSRIDVREILRSIAVPTLVVHRVGDVGVDIDEGRYIAARIPGARLVELPGADHFVAIDPDQILDAVEPFVKENASAPPVDSGRVLATVVVLEIAGGGQPDGDGSTSRSELVRGEIQRYAGEELEAPGERVLALFDGPSRAIRSGLALRQRLDALGLRARVGVHTGEVERADAEVRGVAVEVAGRVAEAAEPGEVLVTATTRDIVAGSGLRFDDRGEHALAGGDEPRRLFAAQG
jgi:pimeloyl-ACP methyl ester carboxylesterase